MLRSWIPIEKIDFEGFCSNRNPSAISILEQHLDKINWNSLSRNPNAISILEQNIDKINFDALSSNPNAISLLESNLDKIEWFNLSSNPNAIHILERNLSKVDWNCLSSNPNAIHILEKNKDKINWTHLCRNPNGIPLLEEVLFQNMNNNNHINNQEEISDYFSLEKCLKSASLDDPTIERPKPNWYYLSGNPNAISLLEQNIDKIDWHYLSSNPNAIHILEKNLDKINWRLLSANPNAISLLEQNMDKVNWIYLCRNPNGIAILQNNINKLFSSDNQFQLRKTATTRTNYLFPDYGQTDVDWSCLSRNPNAINLLEQHPDKINWYSFSSNPSIFYEDDVGVK